MPVLRRPEGDAAGQRGQALVLFALLLVLIVGAAGLLIDGGRAWSERRQAQAAADFAALAAARAIADAGMPCNATGLALGQAAANTVADFNGFANVEVEYPATSSASHTGCSYVLVRVWRDMSTSFSRVYGEDTWTPTADAVVEMVRTVKSVASCTFCSLNSTDKNHTLLIQLGANRRPSTLIVDGEIYVNSSNGKGANDPDSCTDPDILNCGKWVVQGDGFDIFGIGGRMEAKRINVVGGWETHDNGIATAREATCPIDQRPTPPQYPLLPPPVGPILQSNICIHQPAIPDPLKEFLAPTQADYPVQSSQQLVLAGAATHNLQPGVYVGGIRASGNANVVLAPGVYFIAGGGLAISGNANFIADGVTLYNASPTGQTGNAGAISIAGNGRVVLSPPDSGPFGGMTIFQERSSRRSMILNPQNAAQCASQAAQGEPQGCLGGLSGTIYLPGTSANCRAKNDCLVTITATGTANLQIISDKLLVRNGGVARFTYKASGFASTTTTTTLVE